MLTSNQESLTLNVNNFYPNATQKQANSMNFAIAEKRKS